MPVQALRRFRDGSVRRARNAYRAANNWPRVIGLAVGITITVLLGYLTGRPPFSGMRQLLEGVDRAQIAALAHYIQ